MGYREVMQEVTKVLTLIENGDPSAAEKLLPLVYEELRRLAAAKLAREKPGQTLQATALVHEAYLRLLGNQAHDQPSWNGRAHFFAAAAEAMRRILVERARHQQAVVHGGQHQRQHHELDELAIPTDSDPSEILAIHDILDQFAEHSPRKAELVKLRYFLGCTVAESAEILGIAPATAEDDWRYAKAWLKRKLGHLGS